MSLENNIVNFEKRDKPSHTRVLSLPAAIEPVPQMPVIAGKKAEDGGASCENGVCDLDWKPRRPTAAA